METRCDVLIVGGGPAGAATALCLARRGLAAAVLERSGGGGVRIGEAFPPGARSVLQELGVWERFLRDGHRPSLCNLAAWGGPHLEIRQHLFHSDGQGWHLDRSRFDALLVRAAQDAGAVVLAGTALAAVEREAGCWSVRANRRGEPLCLRATWLVDATGRAASLVRRLGGRRPAVDRLAGWTAFLSPAPAAPPLDPAVLIEAMEDGWWYSAPLPDGRAVASFQTDAGLPGCAALRRPAAWWGRLQETCHTRRRLGGCAPPAAVVVRAAGPVRTEMPGMPRFAAVGDASVSFDPLSSMGLLAALRSGIEAAAAIADEQAGRTGALAAYGEQQSQLFDDHLRQRESDYDLEIRWPGTPFWRPRRSPGAASPRLWMHPEQVVARAGSAEARWALGRLEMHHPGLDLRGLAEACRAPRPACQVLESFLRDRPGTVPVQALLALQSLAEHGIVAATATPGRPVESRRDPYVQDVPHPPGDRHRPGREQRRILHRAGEAG